MRQIYPIAGKPFYRMCLVLIFSTILTLGVSLSAPHVLAATMVKVGLLEEPKTLNIWLASDTWSNKVLSQIYQPLYIRDPKTLEFVPWLAKENPVYDEATLSYTVKIRPAQWSDGSELTSKDVAFTGSLIKEFKIPRYSSQWKFITKIETPDKHTVRFYLKKPMAIFLTRTLTTPIVQEKEWLKIAEEARKTEKPLVTLLNYKIEKPVGSGPFVLKEWRQGAYLFLQKNKHFFGKDREINNRKLGPYVDGIVFKVFGTSDAAILALKKGSIDYFWWGIQAGYLTDLQRHKDIRIFSSERSALYYMGFNVRKPPFSDVNLRRAIATLIDKDFIISRILQGYGIKMCSIVPPGNEFWYCPDVQRYGEGLSREERVRKAYEMLCRAGYTWEVPPVDVSGKVVKGEGLRLPGGQPMEKFTILTPPADYDPHRAMSGMMIQEWLRAMGMPAFSKPTAFGSLIQQVKTRRDFDSFILGYGKLSLDPDYVRHFFHSNYDKKQGYNMSGYKNPDFERIADESAGTMDREKRRALIRDMQKIIIRDVPYIPLYNPKLVEAVRKDNVNGWVEMLEGIGNIWSFCQIKPR
jgi:peptide/nickel transport system substrate-binding protein